ncbi:uncharacterized protein LOC122314827 isoform X1 [Carya illinoinensis]|uniref:C2 NT-type domain-containing protein n=2 Tax=Carya illinoinensis TaxID=32201 RepID=A0A922JFC4_CARIL|nr:uncharacterized protein LOC122314827 isoform X1 [Carya illinoinensis]KAG6706506.1 hypothetical protein I3842_07G225000 [Carya illinoinensis]
MKWSPWVATGGMKKLQVKVSQLKLQVLCKEEVKDAAPMSGDKIVMIEIKWRSGPKAGVLAPFYRTSTCQRNYTGHRSLRKLCEPLEWDDEFESVRNFAISKDGSFGPWNLAFNVLYRDGAESRTKMAVLGKVSLNLAELMTSKMETRIKRKLPITLQDSRSSIEATLLVSLSFVEVRDSHDSQRIGPNSAESVKEDLLFAKVKDLTSSFQKKQKPRVSSSDTEEPAVFDSEGSREFITTSYSSNAALTSELESESFPNSETQLSRGRKRGFFSWKRRRLSFGPGQRKGEPLTPNAPQKADAVLSSSEILDFEDDSCVTSKWEVKELESRDGQTKLKTKVYFASFDQRSEQASGESACAALVTVIAHWLHSHQDMPTTSQFDSLIIEGSSEWRNLCNNETYIRSFPDKHFDLDTVLEANLRPLSVVPDKSFVGFFCPEKFELLKEAMSFGEIWKKINSNAELDDEPRVYMVSWNDHFFVLKVEADAYYIIDSLGERLFEGCSQAYILKFDRSSLMYETGGKEKVGSEEMGGGDIGDHKGESNQKIICRGKECCKEFVKRFLAAITLRELEEEKEKTAISNYTLHQRLQIEFHLCSSPSSSATSSTSSLFSSENFKLN